MVPASILALAAAFILSRPGQLSTMLGQADVADGGGLVAGVALGEAKTAGVRRDARHRHSEANFWRTLGRAHVLSARLARRLERCRHRWVLTLVPVAILVASSGGLGPLVHSLWENPSYFQANRAVDPTVCFSRIDALAVFCRISGWSPPPVAKLAVFLGCLASSGGLLLALGRQSEQRRDLSLSTGMVLLTMLICLYHQHYDALLVAPLLVAVLVSRAWSEQPASARWSLAALLAIPLLNYLASETLAPAFNCEAPAGFWSLPATAWPSWQPGRCAWS